MSNSGLILRLLLLFLGLRLERIRWRLFEEVLDGLLTLDGVQLKLLLFFALFRLLLRTLVEEGHPLLFLTVL